ncbi:MAG: NAD(P)/FAD-dependent oxidoreductase [Burkholderiaceae bacterium]
MPGHAPSPDAAFVEPAAGRSFDVLIVGAGLSGIGAAHHLQRACPGTSYAILEARDTLGGTWDLFRYPGIRSDSEMYTLGYGFKPWRGRKAIADGPEILRYLRETADEAGITPNVRFGHRVVGASWSSADARWTLTVRGPDGRDTPWRAQFVLLCAGYYSYAQGHRPSFDGEADFRGRIVHAQFWPEDLDYAGRRVVVIGSGATAVTLVPAMARTAHVTMLQRSPTYVVNRPAEDRLALALGRVLPARLAYRIARVRNVARMMFYYRIAKRRPEMFAQRIVELARAQLPAGFDMRHFTPSYKPWDQRLCVVPDGDLFRAIGEGRADVVTDTIERFTADGVRLASGRELPADLIVLATGLKLNVLGDVEFQVDGRRFDASTAMTYKGMMLSDLPNCVMTFGYTNSSWTLRADLVADFACRLIGHMRRRGLAVVTAPRDPTVEVSPFLALSSGYVQRGAPLLPKQGTRDPWRVTQNYVADLAALRFASLDDGVLRFAREAAA